MGPQKGVIHDDGDGGEALRQPADVIRIGFARRAVACDWPSHLSRYLEVRVERRIVGTIVVAGGMQFDSDRARSQPQAHVGAPGFTRPDPDERRQSGVSYIQTVERPM